MRNKCCRSGCRDCPWNYKRTWFDEITDFIWIVLFVSAIVIIGLTLWILWLPIWPFVYIWQKYFKKPKFEENWDELPVATEKHDQYEEFFVDLKSEELCNDLVKLLKDLRKDFEDIGYNDLVKKIDVVFKENEID
jgi:hypothetical protein